MRIVASIRHCAGGTEPKTMAHINDSKNLIKIKE
jgi:hypothetical protein